ncbi:hypothetical protein [Algibacter sp. PT7-4]|uniref:hypothetical protein n=1 Tax=Algibacter ulvanivorans TaxID=3400999 RepID=UPI003AAE8A12
MKWYFYFISLIILQSCASVPFVKKHNFNISKIKELTTKTYSISLGEKTLKEKTIYTFTKNGRIKLAETYNKEGKLILKKEKKLWFTKEWFPDREAHYCKTRWKPNYRERISCYSQKRHKQNEAIYHYNTNGSISKIEDNFTTFYTHFYYYNAKGNLSKITIKNKDDLLIDEIIIKCLETDYKGLCTKQQRINKRGYITEILNTPTY